jgi:hypothetical protein
MEIELNVKWVIRETETPRILSLPKELVPKQLIAAYLGVSRETLSRLN